MDIRSGDSNTNTTGTLVAIVDDGLRYTHPDINEQLWDGINCLSDNGTSLGNCLYGYDFVNTDNNPLSSGSDTHGTHIAGII
jgi:subtilisin family serine protease